MIKIAIVDDDLTWLQDFKSRLIQTGSLEIIFVANDGAECLQFLESLKSENHPELILLDITMPKLNGIETTKLLKTTYPSIEVIMMTVLDDENTLIDAIIAGAKAYLLKSEKTDKILNIIQMVQSGFALLSPSMSRKIKNVFSNPTKNSLQTPKPSPENALTMREGEILDFLSKGATYQEIAQKLYRDIGTIKTHVNNIYKKLEVHNRTEAINKWKKEG